MRLVRLSVSVGAAMLSAVAAPRARQRVPADHGGGDGPAGLALQQPCGPAAAARPLSLLTQRPWAAVAAACVGAALLWWLLLADRGAAPANASKAAGGGRAW